MVLIGISSIVYIIKSVINSKEKADIKKEVEVKSETIKKPISFIEEDELKSHSDKLIEEMKQRKEDASKL